MAKRGESKSNSNMNSQELKKALSNIGTRIPPHSLEAEISVLGSMMLDKNAVAKTLEILTVESFYNEAHKIIFEAMVKMYEKGMTIDFLTLIEELKSRGKLDTIGGVLYLTEINSRIPTSVFVEQHSRIIQEKFFKRALINTAATILERAYDDSSDALEEIDKAERNIFEIAEHRLKKSYTDLKQLAYDTYSLIEKLSQRDQKDVSGVASGLKDLDIQTGGFQKSDLIIIAARPSMGKTALALSMARNMAVVFEKPVAFFSIEMASVQLMIRLLSSEARIDQQRMRIGKINEDEKREIIRSLGKLSNTPIYIDDSANLGILELRAKCRRLKSEHNIEAVFVDYLQLISSPKAESREREISIISSSLKQIAKELEIPVIALAQLNRSVETRTGSKRPMLSDLRESGSIEQDADVVIFVNRPEFYGQKLYEDDVPTEGTAELIIGKQRNGPTGTVRVGFQKNYARFENLAYQFHNDDEVPNQPNEDIRLDPEFDDDEPF